jgi:hypothetical protein
MTLTIDQQFWGYEVEEKLLIGVGEQIRLYTTVIYLILQAVLGPGVYSASYRNEYEKH